MKNDMNVNPISTNWKKRFSEQPIDVQKKLIELDSMSPNDYQLRLIKRKRVVPTEGDIFVLSPREGIYFYGKVLTSNIQHIANNTFIQGNSVVVIFKCKTQALDDLNFVPNYNDLLIEPTIVTDGYWKKGLFYNVGNQPLTSDELDLDYGFYDIPWRKYVKANGEELSKPPSILGTYGVATLIGVASDIEKELIINPALLETN